MSQKLHHASFVEYTPSGIKCFALNSSRDRLAVGRRNADIEVFHVNSTASHYVPIAHISGKKNTTVQSLVWVGERLLACGLHGQITEWDLHTLAPKQVASSNGGSAWGMVINKAGDLVAVACEDGSVRLIDTTTMLLAATCRTTQTAHDKARLLCVAFSADGQQLWCGGKNLLSRFDLQGNLLSTTPLKSTVMAITATIDGVVCGDETGTLHFMDGSSGVEVQTVKSHDADILSIVAVSTLDRICVSGVDSRLIWYKFDLSTRQWFKTSSSSRGHPNDITTMLIVLDEVKIVDEQSKERETTDASSAEPVETYRLVCGCADGSLYFYNNTIAQHYHQIAPVPPANFISSCTLSPSGQQVVVFTQPYSLHLYLLPNAEHGHKHLLSLQKKGNWGIECSAISRNGHFLAYSCLEGVKLFSLSYDLEEEKVEVKSVEVKVGPALALAFSKNSKQLIVARRDNVLVVLDLDKIDIEDKNPTAHVTHSVDLDDIADVEVKSQNPVVSMCTGRGFLVVARLNSQVLVFSLPKGTDKGEAKKRKTTSSGSTQLELKKSLSVGVHPLLHVAANLQTSVVSVVNANNTVYLFDIGQDSKEVGIVGLKRDKNQDFIRSCIPLLESTLVLQSPSNLFLVNDYNDPLVQAGRLSKKKLNIHHTGYVLGQAAYTTKAESKNDVDATEEGSKKRGREGSEQVMVQSELVFITQNPTSVLSRLPPPFFKKTWSENIFKRKQKH